MLYPVNRSHIFLLVFSFVSTTVDFAVETVKIQKNSSPPPLLLNIA